MTSCAEVTRRLPEILDGIAPADAEVVAHVEECLLCRAELARYRKMLRLLAQLRVERPAMPDGLLEGVLASIEVAAERQVIRSALARHGVAYAAGLVLSAAVATGIFVVAHARRSVKRPTQTPERLSPS